MNFYYLREKQSTIFLTVYFKYRHLFLIATVGADGKLIGLRAEKPPLPRVHSAGTSLKKQALTTSEKPVPSEKPEVPKRTHKVGPTKVL